MDNWEQIAQDFVEYAKQQNKDRITANAAAKWAWNNRRDMMNGAGINGAAKYLGAIFGNKYQRFGREYIIGD